MFNLKEVLLDNPIIAAIRNDEDLKNVLKSNVSIVFVLYGSLLNISEICTKLKENNKVVFVHVDLIEGLKGDNAGICFIKTHARIDGIISTKSSNIKHAKHQGLCTIQRIFVLDSLSLKTGIPSIIETNPTAVEVMPGVASKIIEQIQKKVTLPVIAGGLIKTKKDVIDSLSVGASAVSTTKVELWDL